MIGQLAKLFGLTAICGDFALVFHIQDYMLVGKKTNRIVMVGGIINVAFGRHQCERQHPNFTKFATITCLPLPVIFPTWTKRLFDFQWRSHPDLLCSQVAVLCTNYNLENDCCRQFVKCKLGARQKITAITDGVYCVLLSVFIVLEKCISVNGGVRLWPSCDSWCSWRWTSRLCSQATMFASSEQTLDSWLLISITMCIVSK